MKKSLLLIVMLLGIISLAFTQTKQTSVEYLLQNPELINSAQGDNQIVPPVSDESRELLNGGAYTYVGFFDGLSGPEWTTNPPCYTGQEAAALLFGGVPEDYAISTNSNSVDPNTITFTAWLVGWGISGWYEFPQDYKLDVPPVGYNNPGGAGTSYSAYVWDNPPPPGNTINYVWRVNEKVPLSDWAVGLGVLLIMAATVIRIRRF